MDLIQHSMELFTKFAALGPQKLFRVNAVITGLAFQICPMLWTVDTQDWPPAQCSYIFDTMHTIVLLLEGVGVTYARE